MSQRLSGKACGFGRLSLLAGPRASGRSSASQGHGVDDLLQLAAEPLPARLLVLLQRRKDLDKNREEG